MKSMPENVVPYKRTPEFNEASVPAALLNAHQTKEGVWGKIVVIEGELEYTILEPQPQVYILDRDNFGVVEPTVLHHVKPLGPMKFYVEFHH